MPAPRNCADLEALHREFYNRLVRVCTQQLRDRNLAEDVAQDTILRALRFWSSYDAERPTWPWLKRIALHLCLDARRARSHEVCLDSLPDRAEATDRTERLIDEITVRGAMAGLPERQAMALQLRYFDDRDRDASAEALGVNVNAFDQLLNRARMRLARVIEPAGAGSALGIVLLPLRWLRRRRLPRALGGGGTASTLALGAATTLPLAVAPLIAIVAGMAPEASPAVYAAANARTANPAKAVSAPRPAAAPRHAPAVRPASPRTAPRVNLRLGAGPATVHTHVARSPYGAFEDYQIRVYTPVTTITVGGVSHNDPRYRVGCSLPGVDCS
ncbi:MAG: sigma-70 family RNA polymerase sigma factor [Frankiales bacterium]|nr:sigma-70 family RNA polymerase sigma factor [Frankiales bacterium]